MPVRLSRHPQLFKRALETTFFQVSNDAAGADARDEAQRLRGFAGPFVMM
jgi:hypothetical protein